MRTILASDRPLTQVRESIENFLLFFDTLSGPVLLLFFNPELHPGVEIALWGGGGGGGKREKTKSGGKKGKRKSVITTNHLADERILYFRGTILPAVAKRELSHLFVLLSCKLLGQFSKTGRTKNNEREREKYIYMYTHHKNISYLGQTL